MNYDGDEVTFYLTEADGMAGSGRREAARVMRDRALMALSESADSDRALAARQKLAGLFLAAGEAEKAVYALGPAIDAPGTPPPLARAALYTAAADLRGGAAMADKTSALAARVLRLASFRPDDIRLVQQEMARLLDPYAGEHGSVVDQHRPTIDSSNVYAICMTPRSGSNFLVQCLTDSGVLGQPGEYLHRNEPTAMPAIVARFGTPTLAAVMAEVMHRTRSPNGVFGIKLHIGMLLPLLVEGVFARTLATGKFIYTTREDILAQAISYARAQMTGVWISKNEAQAPPEFSFTAIHDAIRYLSEMMAQWETFFALHNIKPLRVTYEQIDRDIDGTVARVADHVGVKLAGPTHFRDNRETVQRDGLSGQWRKRFIEMAGATPA